MCPVRSFGMLDIYRQPTNAIWVPQIPAFHYAQSRFFTHEEQLIRSFRREFSCKWPDLDMFQIYVGS